MCMLKCKMHSKRNDLDIMVADIEPDILGITELWEHHDMAEAELVLPDYVMFKNDKREKGRWSRYVY